MTKGVYLIFILAVLSCRLTVAEDRIAKKLDEVDFNIDVRPILAAACFPCHGPDEAHQEAGLRLDLRQYALDAGAIDPEDYGDSELKRRVLSDDPDERMPPPDSGEALTDAQRELLRRWVDQGAQYDQHWAFERPSRPEIPAVENATWTRNAIDRFVLSRLEQQAMTPSEEADRYTLVRRLYLDLIGLPPTPAEADQFVNDRSPDAYERLVERLLDSPHYGEKWARHWLDLARYADTNGYEKDRERSIWPYRDWVIRALNGDMPYDQFSVEQLAGDMLEHPTESQRVATGFHRNTMLNEEGGIDPLEYRFYSMVDRVATTGTVWLGLTVGCAQCHTHKYDPITHNDYYGFMALMNNADEPDFVIADRDVQHRRAEIEAAIEELWLQIQRSYPAKKHSSDAAGEAQPSAPPNEEQGELAVRKPGAEQGSRGETPAAIDPQEALQAAFEKWLDESRKEVLDWQVVRPSHMETNLPKLEVLGDDSILSTGDVTKRDRFLLRLAVDGSRRPITAIRLEVMPDERLPAGGPGRCYYEGRKGDFFLSEFGARMHGEPLVFGAASHSYGKISIGSGNANAGNVLDGDGSTGWSTSGREGESHRLVLNFNQPIADVGELELSMLFERHFAASLGRFRLWLTSSQQPALALEFPTRIQGLLSRPEQDTSADERHELLRYFLSVAPELEEARKPIEALQAEMPSLPGTLVMQERPTDNPRRSYRHHRGEYLSPREEIAPRIPDFLADDGDRPANRLEFARWLVSSRNPLAARVAVNRVWQSIMGRGLQESTDDFGTQAPMPSHPLLLDWLACEFVDSGWSMKKLHRLIVCSATYRQVSSVSDELRAVDRDNVLLARGPRFRMPAEIIRDIMLHSSGLLSTQMYGPGVRPPQPQSVTAVAYGSPAWKPSTGGDQFRRSIYTFAKRTAPFAAYTTFDAPTGENCVAMRDRSNTPLQALTLLNDQMFLTMAQELGMQISRREAAIDDNAVYAFRRLLTRPPTDAEVDSIVQFYERQRERLQNGQLSAEEIMGRPSSDQAAAWSMVARALMNLDEVITKN